MALDFSIGAFFSIKGEVIMVICALLFNLLAVYNPSIHPFYRVLLFVFKTPKSLCPVHLTEFKRILFAISTFGL